MDRDKYTEKTVWKLFEKTGEIGYYLLYNKLRKKD